MWIPKAICNLPVQEEYWNSIAVAWDRQPASPRSLAPCRGSSDAALPPHLCVQSGAQRRGTSALLHRASSWQAGIFPLPCLPRLLRETSRVSDCAPSGPRPRGALYGKDCVLTVRSQHGSGTEPALETQSACKKCAAILKELCRKLP